MSVCGVGAPIFAASPRPDIPLFAGGFPPRMLTSTPLFPAFVAPPLVPAPPTAPAAAFGAPPGTPGLLPSGEIETRAARFPSGGVTGAGGAGAAERATRDRKSTRLNSSHGYISYAVFCLKKKLETGPLR